MKRTTTTAAAAGLSLAAALTLSACANPLDALIENVVGGGVENLIEDQTGVDVSVPGSGGASLPDSWPADVPTPEGEVLFSVATGENWTATIEVADQGTIDRLYTDLEGAGYSLTAEADFGGILTRTYELGSRIVTVGVIADEEAGTLTLQYGIVDSGNQ